MIKLPKDIVIYAMSGRRPQYLLCWVPVMFYEQLARDQQALSSLLEHYPDGIEVEFSPEALNEAGLGLDVSFRKLRHAYLALHQLGQLHKSGMAELGKLREVADQMEAGRSIEEITAPPKPGVLSLDEEVTRIDKAPEMFGDEDAVDVFQRISGGSSNSEKKGE